jgi:chromate reductase
LSNAVRILGLSGSLQRHSSNAALLDVARSIGGEDRELVVFGDLANVPNFNPDIDHEPPVITAFRALLATSDGVLIATPEYAHGLPGSLKNLLDWMVGTGDLYEKNVVILSGAPAAERGLHARADLERTLRAQGAFVLRSETVVVPTRIRGAEGDDPEIRACVDRALGAFAAPRPPAPAPSLSV